MTRDLPIRSPRPDWRGLLLALCALSASAHEQDPAGHVLTPILSVGGRWLESERPWPENRLPGVLEASGQSAWKQGLAEDYADIGAQWDVSRWRAVVKGSWHGPDGGNAFSVEQAWLRGRFEPVEGQALAIRAGRSMVSFGLLNREHAHNHEFGVEPLVYRAAVGDGWRDDGLEARWDFGPQWFAAAGAYAGDLFPGAATTGPGAFLLQAGRERPDQALILGLARLDAEGRPTRSATALGHTHSQSACRVPALNEVCFQGNAWLLSLSGRWKPASLPLTLEGEFWAKRDEGDLFSTVGYADYRGTLEGGWLTTRWSFRPGWNALLRVEALTASHDLDGPGAALVATQAGVADSGHVLSRAGAGVRWQPTNWQTVGLEWHYEDAGAAAGSSGIWLARYQLDLARLFESGH